MENHVSRPLPRACESHDATISVEKDFCHSRNVLSVLSRCCNVFSPSLGLFNHHRVEALWFLEGRNGWFGLKTCQTGAAAHDHATAERTAGYGHGLFYQICQPRICQLRRYQLCSYQIHIHRWLIAERPFWVCS